MEIKSSLLNYKEFNHLKDSIIKISSIDGKDKFRVKLVEYINDTSDNNDDMFFYEMLPFARFLNPSDQAIAYTTPDHLIYLNSPGSVGENVRKWDFIYCHECLHQLWDTFEVGEKIKKAGFEYNHQLLNIASDCVINDYLKTLRNKEPFENGIFPETLKKEFDIDYDRKNDTQYSLYIKLLNAYEENKNELENLIKQMEKQEGGDSQQNGQSSSSSSSNSSNQSNSSSSSSDDSSDNSNNQSKELDANSAQKAADKAKKNMEEAQNKADSNSDDETLQEKANKAKEAAKRAQDAADKAKECAKNGDKEGEKKAAEEAERAAEEAERAAKEEKDAKESDKSSKNDNKSNSKKAGNDEATDNSIEDINEIRKDAEEIIKKYKNKLTGPLGDFLSKCESSSSLKREGLKVKTSYGNAGWNTQMNKICKAFVKKKIFQKKRQYEKTYSRVRRGSGFVKFGNPIEPGRKIKEDKMDINVAFYIDKSGSMYNSIDNVFEAVFYIADALKKYFGKEKVVNDTIFESYAFDVSLHKLKFGKKMKANGGTMPFNKLLEYINEYSKDFLINVIVTDAQFSGINVSTVKDLLNEIDGIIIFITNTANTTMEDISKKYSTKLNYILANEDFKLS